MRAFISDVIALPLAGLGDGRARRFREFQTPVKSGVFVAGVCADSTPASETASNASRKIRGRLSIRSSRVANEIQSSFVGLYRFLHLLSTRPQLKELLAE
jgi:hypothetical protein